MLIQQTRRALCLILTHPTQRGLQKCITENGGLFQKQGKRITGKKVQNQNDSSIKSRKCITTKTCDTAVIQMYHICIAFVSQTEINLN